MLLLISFYIDVVAYDFTHSACSIIPLYSLCMLQLDLGVPVPAEPPAGAATGDEPDPHDTARVAHAVLRLGRPRNNGKQKFCYFSEIVSQLPASK